MPVSTQTREGPLLVVEDSDEDFASLQWAFRKLRITRPTVRCVDGDSALEYLHDAVPPPSLVLLDLNLISVDGQEVLREMKEDPELRGIPVVIWTTSSNPRDVNGCYRRGANTYLRKPVNMDDLLDAVQSLMHYWFEIAALPRPESRR